MTLHKRLAVVVTVLVLLAGSAFGRNLPNVDAFGAGKPNPNSNAQLAQKAGNLVKAGSKLHAETRLGVPTFLWLSEQANLNGGGPISNGPERREVAAARGHLSAVAELYNLDATDVRAAVPAIVHNVGRGPVIVKFMQSVGGVEVFREELNVVMNQSLEAIALTGYITSQATPSAIPGRTTWDVQPRNAAINALNDSTDRTFGISALTPAFTRDGYEFFNATTDNSISVEPVRMKKVWFHVQDGLVPAYYIEVISSPILHDAQIGPVEDSAYSYVISATDGSILFRKNLISEAANKGGQQNALPPGGFTYRVWADPDTGIPYDTPAGNGPHPKLVPLPDGAQAPFVSTHDVTLPNFPFSMNDPWLAPGATETNGNNVDAFLNLFSPDGLGNPVTTTPTDFPNGDHRAQITGAGQFLHNHQPDVDAYSAAARSGSITQLFYNINFLHDWFYDEGFNEAGRNAQKDNYGRGGLASDDIKGQSGDFQSFSNANMLTPADGQRPRMRMYNFPNLANTLDVQAPAAIVGKQRLGISMTGIRNFDITSDIVIATFTAGPTTCTITNAAALTGKIAMFDFDNTDATGCAFSTRVARIHATGAAAALMVYTSANATAVANITGFNATHTKPIGVISWNSGQAIKSQLALPATVTARLLRVADRDGSLDNQIVFHEWGHYISNRLIGNSAGLNNQQGGSMGEGWGDFLAMLLTVREEDTATPSNADWGGVYALATYATSGVNYTGAANHGYYLGIRRVPYSTDMVNYNALTFKHIDDSQTLPTGPPIATGGPNSEVHNSGEIWTTMLWECYASLLRDTLGPLPRLTFTEAQARMKLYLVASFMMTPSSPTYLEARDAVLAAAYATDVTDYALFWQAFAKRGAGLYAVAPDRYSTNHAGVVESYDAVPELTILTPSINDSVASCDNDGVLDSGDTGKLTVSIKNVGTSALVNTTATITSATPGVSFPNGNVINFPTSDPLATVSASVNVAYAAGMAGAQQLDFQIEVADPSISGTRIKNWGVRANTNAIPASTATETVEHTSSPFTFTFNNTLPNIKPWVRKEVTPMQHVFHVDDADGANDQYLTSPVFTVDGSGSMNVQFDHSHQFEFDGGGFYDGGVIEMSVNGGAWTDIGTSVYGGPTNVLINYAGNLNPLKGRQAFVANSAGTVHVSLTQAIAPGSTVQVRWRFGSDNALGAPGWNVDNIQFSGVVETPFATVVADPGCAIATATSLSPSANPSPFGANLTLTATVSSTGGTPNGGTVTFFDGAVNLGSSPVAAGTATLMTSSLAIGPHTLTANYSGTTGYLPSNSPSVVETIGKAATSVGVTSTANPQNYGVPITFFATVTSTAGTPAGSVTWYDGVTPLATDVLNGSGVATYSTVGLSGGSHTISAKYLGNTTYATSTGSMVQVINTGSTIQFNPTAYSKFEDAGTVTLTVTRTGGSTGGPATVQYATVAGTAVAGVRYVTASGQVSFGPSETSKPLVITLNDTAAIEGKQTFTVVLSSAVGGTLGSSTATIDIMDDDTAKTDFSFPLDGKNDIVWRNETTGDTKIWTMDGTTFLLSADLLQFGGNWRLQGAADFNADGSADLLYRNTVDFSTVIWYMQGANIIGTSSVIASPDANWKIQAIGDINGDGYPDLLWRHSTTFTTAVWLMKDNVRLSVYTLPSITDANWQVKGMGDFNRDGQLDIVWRNVTTFTTAVWYLTPGGATRDSIGTITPVSGSPWDIVGVGDFNNDGDADLIWQASTTRTLAIWLMNQNVRSSIVVPPTINSASWNVVAPR